MLLLLLLAEWKEEGNCRCTEEGSCNDGPLCEKIKLKRTREKA